MTGFTHIPRCPNWNIQKGSKLDMKWIKHLVDSGDDPDIEDAVSLFGPTAYYIFFRTLEIMGREFDIENPGHNLFLTSFLRRKLRTKWKTFLKVMGFFQERKRFVFEIKGKGKTESIEIYNPKLKGLCDEWTRKALKKLRSDSGADSGATPALEEEVD